MKKAMCLRFMAVSVAALFTGCETAKEGLTGSLWQSHHFTHFREPAPEARLAVFYAPAFDDYLVAYDSVRDDEDEPRRQSFFVIANEANLASHKKPSLISTNGLGLVAVPLNGATNVFPHATYDSRLTIRTAEERFGPYPLPNYKESDGVAIKTALTPLAVAGDATIVGLVLGAVFGVAWWGSGVSIDAP